MKKRRHIFRNAWLLTAVLIGLLLADSGLRIVTTDYALNYAELPEAFDGFRIVQLSDLHGACFGKENAHLLRRVRKAAPDIIAITGDLADGNTDMAVIDSLLSELTEIAPVYYVSGNHEWSERQLNALQVLLDRYGVIYLRNAYLCLQRDGEKIILAGTEDPNGWKDQPKPDAFLADLRVLEPETFTILLTHRNDFFEKYPGLPAQLILCGHAHGGVVRLPGIGGVLGTGGTWFPDFTDGVYDSGSCRMVVSRGLGASQRIPRFLNNPEIVAVTLYVG